MLKKEKKEKGMLLLNMKERGKIKCGFLQGNRKNMKATILSITAATFRIVTKNLEKI